LRLRRDRAELFTRYVPLSAAGAASGHVVAFDRGGAITVATRLPIGLENAGGWGTTELLAPAGTWRDELTDQTFAGGAIPLATLLARYPVALLVRDDAP
jgi:(1->4)-alpha-D-glucan 1-alpha-D-glucosylmutase